MIVLTSKTLIGETMTAKVGVFACRRSRLAATSSSSGLTRRVNYGIVKRTSATSTRTPPTVVAHRQDAVGDVDVFVARWKENAIPESTRGGSSCGSSSGSRSRRFALSSVVAGLLPGVGFVACGAMTSPPPAEAFDIASYLVPKNDRSLDIAPLDVNTLASGASGSGAAADDGGAAPALSLIHI